MGDGLVEVRNQRDGLRQLDTGARLDFDHVAAVNRDRQGASLMQTLPVIGTGTPPEGPMPSRSMPIEPVERVLPAKGEGFRTYGRGEAGANQVGTDEFVTRLQMLGLAWSGTGHAPISFGDISQEGGGPMPGHRGHQGGLEVDVRPFRSDGRNIATTWQSPAYDRSATRQFIQMVRQQHPQATVLFNDPELVREGLAKPFQDHDNHLHVRFGAAADRPTRMRAR